MALLMKLMTFLMASMNGNNTNMEKSISEDVVGHGVDERPEDELNSSIGSVASDRSKKRKSTPAQRKRRKQSSQMWDHFTKSNDGKTVMCKHCKHIFPWHNSTSSHTSHLRTKHGNIVNIASSSIRRYTVEHNEVKNKGKSVSQERSRKITNAVLQLMTLDLMPFSLVEGRGLINLLHVLEPGYTIPHRTTFSRFFLPDQYRIVKEIVIAELLRASHISIAFNLWTDNFKGLNFISLVAHFVDNNWALRKVVLATRR